ncbi:MAG: hypothetical protein AAGH76_06190 [Pseudomonadota bacterium]
MIRFSIIAAVLGIVSPVFADDYATPPDAGKSSTLTTEQRMDQWRREGRRLNFIADHDHDNDQRVSSIEFEQSRRVRFDATDTNSDGVVDTQEYVYEWEDRLDAQLEEDRTGRVRQTYVRFAAMDKDDDEFMSWNEYAASGERMFTGFDTNKDGTVNAQDPKRVRNWTPKADNELTAEEREQRRERKMAYARNMLVMPTTHNMDGMMVRYDLDQDGEITREEFDGKRRADYDGTDFNSDGTLDADEYASEFEDRMDAVIETFRADSVRQSQRRFESLDKNDDGTMTFAEYRESGNRIFARYDASHDGYVNIDDPLPAPFSDADVQEVVANSAD